MVIDSSALVAILLGEPAATALAKAIATDSRRLICAMTALETAVVMGVRKGPSGDREFDLLAHRCQIEIVNMNSDQVRLAREAHARYGKGRHGASLNLGDCCSYALARYSGEPLLFVGADFSRTDIQAAAY